MGGNNEVLSVGNVRRWLRDPIDLDWTVGFVQRRGAGRLKSGALLVGCVTLMVAIGASLWCPAGEFPGFVRLVMWAALPALLVAGVRWSLSPLVPRVESIAAVFVADAGIALACLTHQTRMAGIAGTALFALMGIGMVATSLLLMRFRSRLRRRGLIFMSFMLFGTNQRTEPGQIARVDLIPRAPRFREDLFRDLFSDPRTAAPAGASRAPPSVGMFSRPSHSVRNHRRYMGS